MHPFEHMMELPEWCPSDPNSVANTEAFRVKHIEMDWVIDFGQQRVFGHVILHIDHMDQSSSEVLVLDASALEIHHVSDVNGQALDFNYEANGGKFGGRLSIEVPSISQIKIEYSTTAAGQALQWLRPE